MRLKVVAVVMAVAAGMIGGPAGSETAFAAQFRVSNPRIVAHFNLSAGQTPENVAVEPDGSADVALSSVSEVVHVSLAGEVNVLAQLPRSGSCAPSAVPLILGLARSGDGTLFVVDCTDDANTGVWRVRPGQAPVQIASLPATGFPNDMVLDRGRHQLYIADSVLATVWRVSTEGGTPVAWASDAALARTSFLGANGIALHDGAVWVSNTDQGTIVEIPILPNGGAGPVQTAVTGAGAIDNITFVPGTDAILAALPAANEVVLIQHGQILPVLTTADGLSNPTAVEVKDETIYVCDGAVAGGTDPNLLVAHIDE